MRKPRPCPPKGWYTVCWWHKGRRICRKHYCGSIKVPKYALGLVFRSKK